MNSGLVGALGTAPLQTVKARLGSFQGRSHTHIPIAKDGAFILGPTPDGTAIGGNKRGTGAVDLQLVRTQATRVASGLNSFIAGSLNSTTSGNNSVVIGGGLGSASGPNSALVGTSSCTASGTNAAVIAGNFTTSSGDTSLATGFDTLASSSFSVAMGNRCQSTASSALAHGTRALANRVGMRAQSGGFFSVTGDGQSIELTSMCRTTSTTPAELFLDNSSARISIPNGKILSATINIVGTKSDGTSVAQFVRKACIKNVAGTTSLVNSVETIGTDTVNGTSVSITADDTNDALKIEVTGITSETWRWVASIEGVEIAYGT